MRKLRLGRVKQLVKKKKKSHTRSKWQNQESNWSIRFQAPAPFCSASCCFSTDGTFPSPCEVSPNSNFVTFSPQFQWSCGLCLTTISSHSPTLNFYPNTMWAALASVQTGTSPSKYALPLGSQVIPQSIYPPGLGNFAHLYSFLPLVSLFNQLY